MRGFDSTKRGAEGEGPGASADATSAAAHGGGDHGGPGTDPSRVKAYGPSILAGTAAVVCALLQHDLLAPGLFLLFGAVSFLQGRSLLQRIRQADRHRSLLDAQLLQSQKLASIGELSAGIAHEINNPLAIIARETEWLRHLLEGLTGRETRERADFSDSLREIAVQVDRCKEITQNLLNFARKVEPVLQEVNVNKLVQDMAKLVERDARELDIVVQRELSPETPIILSDAPCLRQVVLNLLNNARQAIGKGGTITVGSRAAMEGEEIEIFVKDTGCGIPKEHLPKIFDPFFTTKPHGKGTGLGLSICHGIVDRLGGRISVSSEVGKGSTFTVSLPKDPRRARR